VIGEALAGCAGAFGVGFVTEWAYVGFVRASVAGRPLPASLWCSILVALGWAAIFLMVQFTWFMAVPALAGHSLGTYLAVRRHACDEIPTGPPSS
jgi:hypothetical protein